MGKFIQIGPNSFMNQFSGSKNEFKVLRMKILAVDFPNSNICLTMTLCY